MNKIKLSQTLSYILRHKPSAYGITLDKHGWVDLQALLNNISARHPQYAAADQQTIEDIIHDSDKTRFELEDGKIRAFYGHTIANKIDHQNT